MRTTKWAGIFSCSACGILHRVSADGWNIRKNIDIYPVDMPTIIFCRARQVDLEAGGQQECPFMMACHAAVQRMLLERLSVVEVDPRTSSVLPMWNPPADLDVSPMFADDGFCCGASARSPQSTCACESTDATSWSSILAVAGHASCRFSTCNPAGAIIDVGCSVNLSGDLEILRSPTGSATFCSEYSCRRVQKSIQMMMAISKLADPQVSYYLIWWVCSVSRLNHLMRTTPRGHCQDATSIFDEATRTAFTEFTGLALSDSQWKQVCSPT